MELNLDLVDEELNKGSKFAIRITTFEELEAIGVAVLERCPGAWNPWIGKEARYSWEAYWERKEVLKHGLSLNIGLRGDRADCCWCNTDWYIDEGYTVIDFDDLVVDDIAAPPISLLFGGV